MLPEMPELMISGMSKKWSSLCGVKISFLSQLSWLGRGAWLQVDLQLPSPGFGPCFSSSGGCVVTPAMAVVCLMSLGPAEHRLKCRST